MRLCVAIVMGACLSACAALHRTQLGDIEPAGKSARISVKISETTIDFREMAALAKLGGHLFNSRGATNVGKGLGAYASLFQYGPHTGTPVFNELYARYIPELLREKCAGGRLANILSVREARDYPVVKGEIVRIDADCVR